MVNSNPETVSTDYDTRSRLYFEPLSAEDVLAVCEAERPVGVICQLGGQTPLRLAHDLEAARVRVLGTPPAAIDLAEDRASSPSSCASSGSPRRRTARRAISRRRGASRLGIGYPGRRAARATCSAAGRWRSCTTRTSSRVRPHGRRGEAGPSRADRPVPRGRDRGRRRRRVRRDGRVHRRGDGAHRGGRRAFGRLLVRRSRRRRCPTRSSTRSRTSPARSPGGSASSGCSTCSSR